jgi:hypothetical protein
MASAEPRPRKTLTFQHGGRPLRFTVRRLLVAGYTGRDPEAVRLHIEELEREGVPPPAHVPTLFLANPTTLQLGGTIWAYDGSSSGEVEYVLLIGAGDVYVCIGSDHTDRGLETLSVDKSKQIYPRILSREAWRLDDLIGDWDELGLRSAVGDAGALADYQRGTLGQLIRPEKLLELLGPARVPGTAVLSGTLPVLDGRIRFTPHFEAELTSPAGKVLATVAYDVGVLEQPTLPSDGA